MSDNCGEYKDTIFKMFCYEYEIIIETSVSITPQHNGVDERMNIKLTKRSKSLCVKASLPK